MLTHSHEVFISVDVETAGPNPSGYSLLSIGACLALQPEDAFYVELQPEHDAFLASALEVSGLSLAGLAERGLPAAEALARFEAWVQERTPPGGRPIFVAFNAPFDWMFVADSFHRWLGRNPFGHNALDIKALYMGLTGVPWSQTGMRQVAERYGRPTSLTHNALADAQDQARLFGAILDELHGIRSERG